MEVAEEQAKDEVWSEVISWIDKGQLLEKAETWGKTREVLATRSLFDPAVFKLIGGVLMYTKAANQHQTREVGRICLPASMVKEVWSLCHQSDQGGHRGLERTLNKFLRGFFMLLARTKLRFLNGGCDTCIVKEQSIPVWDTYAIFDKICRRKVIHRFSVYVGYRERESILAHGGG